MSRFIPCFFLLVFNLPPLFTQTSWAAQASSPSQLKILTVANQIGESDSLSRYLKIAQLSQLKVNVLEGKENGLSLNSFQKINLLLSHLSSKSYAPDDVILFTESHNIIILGNAIEIVDRFYKSNCDVLLSIDVRDMPCDQHLCHVDPKLTNGKVLSGFIGRHEKVVEILQNFAKKSEFLECQLPVTWLINCEGSKIGDEEIKIKLDSNSNLFYNLNKKVSKIKMDLQNQTQNGKSPGVFLNDMKMKNKILILHGNNSNRASLDFYANQILNLAPLESPQFNFEKDVPVVTIAIFIKLAPFLEEFLNKIYSLDYPKNKINLFVWNNAPYHAPLIENWFHENSTKYAQAHLINSNETMGEIMARHFAIKWTLDTKIKSEFYFSVDSTAHLNNPRTLKELIQEDVGVIAPMLVRPGRSWPNFDMDLTSSVTGAYDKIQNYLDIVKGRRRGVWNVPFITGVYLIQGKIFRDENEQPIYASLNTQNGSMGDIEFCAQNRRRGTFMFVTNRLDWGHMVNLEEFGKTLKKGRLHPELFQFFSNRWAWEDRYVHPNYTFFLNSTNLASALQICPDVYQFPLLTQRFCDELIAEMEHHGNWSGYQVVEEKDPAPTSDIGLDQLEMGHQWFEFLRQYVQPLQLLVYPYYRSTKFATDIPFVIRYQPDGRKILNPHLDESTYTINIALNTAGKDFEGGGVRFTRYNCSVLDNKPGWLLMHPGELTHQHHGLVVTKGKRYVLISFVDPPLYFGDMEVDTK